MDILILVAMGLLNAISLDQANLEFIRLSLSKDFKGALLVGLGASVGDMVYFLLAAMGFLNIVADLRLKIFITLTGGFTLLVLGVRTFYPVLHINRKQRFIIISGNKFLVGLILSLMNPMVTLCTFGILEYIQITPDLFFSKIFVYFAGLLIATGSFALVLHWLSRQLTDGIVKTIDKLCGLGYIIFGSAIITATLPGALDLLM